MSMTARSLLGSTMCVDKQHETIKDDERQRQHNDSEIVKKSQFDFVW